MPAKIIVPKYSAREILKNARDESKKYDYKFSDFISAKSFYLLRKTKIAEMNSIQITSQISSILMSHGINPALEELQRIMQLTNKLYMALLLVRMKHMNNSQIQSNALNRIAMMLFLIRLESHKALTGQVDKSLMLSNSLNELGINFVMPVCPDYSYKINKHGRYEYTFKNLGCGVGLVAQKAIKNSEIINLIGKQFPTGLIDYKINILVGDFEATLENCTALNETLSSFQRKCQQSASAIQEKSKDIYTGVFTMLCDGIEQWRSVNAYVKYFCKLDTFADLGTLYPEINHERSLISRIPLYRKWFGDSADIKSIFLRQIVEYATMGLMIKRSYGENAVIIASDHRAMRKYYNLVTDTTLFGSGAEY